MNKNLLFIIEEQIESILPLIIKLRERAEYSIIISPYAKLFSEGNRDHLKEQNVSDIIIAGSGNFIDEHFIELKDFITSLYDNYCDNLLYIYSIHDYTQGKTFIARKKNCYIVSEDLSNLSVQAQNFDYLISKVFNELTLTSRLSSYIVDSFHEIVESEILKNQKNEIEILNTELDKKNAEFMKDLRLAQRVQSCLIPDYDLLPKTDGLDFGFVYSPMESLGGDIFDIIQMSETEYCFLMADVSGHGVPAALITTMAKVFFNSYSKWGIDPGETCRRVHDDMKTFFGDLYYYITAIYGTIYLDTSEFKYTNAGHQPLILYRSKTNSIEMLHSNGTLIGILDNPDYKTDSVTLEKGDRLLFFTDGIIEARNEYLQLYGKERLLHFMNSYSNLEPKSFVDKLINDVEYFCGSQPPDDDKAVMLIEFLSG